MKGERKRTTLSEELEWSNKGRRVKPSEGSDPPEEKPDMSESQH